MKKRMFCNLQLLISGTSFVIFTPLFLLVMLYFVKPKGYSIPDEDIRNILLLTYLPMIIGGLAASPRWTPNITLDDKGITYRAWFRKKRFSPYEDYYVIAHAWYYYYGKKRNYIVLAKRSITDFERENVNHAAPSEKFIKIKCTEKNVKFLTERLPKKQANRVKSIYESILTEK